MKLIALDPGGTTGYAIVNTSTYHVTSAQIGPGLHHVALYDLLDFTNADVVICEDFKVQPRQGGYDLTPVEYIGIARLWAMERDQRLVMQSRSFKMLWDDGKIKACGLWIPGKPHAMDAVRHLLYYLTLDAGDRHFLKRLEP